MRTTACKTWEHNCNISQCFKAKHFVINKAKTTGLYHSNYVYNQVHISILLCSTQYRMLYTSFFCDIIYNKLFIAWTVFSLSLPVNHLYSLHSTSLAVYYKKLFVNVKTKINRLQAICDRIKITLNKKGDAIENLANCGTPNSFMILKCVCYP